MTIERQDSVNSKATQSDNGVLGPSLVRGRDIGGTGRDLPGSSKYYHINNIG